MVTGSGSAPRVRLRIFDPQHRVEGLALVVDDVAGKADGRERRPQFVRHVGDEPLLQLRKRRQLVDLALEAVGHPVERSCQRCEDVLALLGHAHREGAASVTQIELLGEPPPSRPDDVTPWPLWPMKLRTSYALKEGGERDFAISTTALAGTGGRVEQNRGAPHRHLFHDDHAGIDLPVRDGGPQRDPERAANWARQRALGVTNIPSNDFSLYDHVLDTSVMVGAIPEICGWTGGPVPLETYFAMARGSPS